ncbi:lipoprotein LpqH [Mycobacteroides salmoniphilum]|uniref:lipoprotein LpqH n=1 Tax=Mycobacteroides salmoniphilum TaxID=404941 RepID=UPI000991A410|nr:lipoprotein LpqH [Mycobacteroides salmoniphilum]
MRYGGIVMVGGALSAVVFLVGCSSGGGLRHDSPVSTTAPGVQAAGPRVVVDGVVRSVENRVECVTAADMTFVNIGSDSEAIAATLAAGDNPTLQSLTLGVIDGHPVMYNSGHGATEPTVTKSGQSYKIAGSATAGLSTPATFELEFTCPARR